MLYVSVCLLWLLIVSQAFYLPGVAPRDYQTGETVEIKVNKLDSVLTQLPYDYYSLPFCAPDEVELKAENLGEILTGDRIENSLYDVSAKLTQMCKILCTRKYTDAELKHFADRIRDKYQVNMIADNIPATTKHYLNTAQAIYEKGFALGFIGSTLTRNAKSGVAYINNHIMIKLLIHQNEDDDDVRIVGFEVTPHSVHHERGNHKDVLNTCLDQQHLLGELRAQAVEGIEVAADDLKSITWTYDVVWEKSPVKWSSRWDNFLKMTNSEIHWFSIVNSMIIVMFLTAFVAIILIRTLRNDLSDYNNNNMSSQDKEDETGWKLVHGDVFRPPPYAGLFAVLVGSGVQVFCMNVLTLFFALLGFLSPANRGGLMTAFLVLFVFMGVLAGYASTRLHSLFKLQEQSKHTLFTALFFPGIVFIVFFILNLFIWGEKSSGAVPFNTLLALLVLWFGISVPLVYLGASYASRKAAMRPPIKVNPLPRAILPSDRYFNRPEFSILLGGILPFAAAFVEIFFIMSSVWLHQFYYIFGFLFVVFVIVMIVCAEISVVLCYFQLCQEDYNWWWQSFLTSGSSALYLFLYSGFYFVTKLEIKGVVPAILFFGYMLLVSFTFFLFTGTIGFLACYLFISKIYTSVKID